MQAVLRPQRPEPFCQRTRETDPIPERSQDSPASRQVGSRNWQISKKCGNLVDDLRPSLEMRRRPSMTMAEPRLVGPFPREMARDGQMESQSRRDPLSPCLQSLVNSRVSRSEAGSTLEPQNSGRQSPDELHAWMNAARSTWSRLLSL
jgi:hypothetical protein